MTIFVIDRVESIVGKEKMLVTNIFSFSHIFRGLFTKGRLKSGLCGKKSKGMHYDLASTLSNNRVQRFPEKILVLYDERLSKGTCPALIYTRPLSDQFILKRFQKSYFFPPILVGYKS